MSKNSSGGHNINLLAIVGPTASGKSALAIEIAKQHGGEVICADSRTIYKGLDIGTAKPNVLEREGIPHHGLDLVEPYESYSAADFQEYALGTIEEIHHRGNLPILVGGSGLYIDGVLYGYKFGEPANLEQRAKLEDLSVEELQQKILDEAIEMPENSFNKRYLIRAIEQGGVNRSKQPLMQGALIIGLDPGPDILSERIRQRADQMLDNGVLEEVRLIEEDYGWDSPGATGNIYQALRPYADGSTNDLDSCLERFIQLDKQLAKRQRSWFKRNKDIHWFINPEEALVFINARLASGG